MELVARSVGR